MHILNYSVALYCWRPTVYSVAFLLLPRQTTTMLQNKSYSNTIVAAYPWSGV